MNFSDNTSTTEKSDLSEEKSSPSRADDVISILATITPNMIMVLVEPERVLTAVNTISLNIIAPTFKAKSFPDNVTQSLLDLLYQIARLPGTQKAWKKDLSDAFNDARFFHTSTGLLKSNWLSLLRQWTLSDKERLPELLSRLTPPTTAGIVFGVGATSARLEADRKAQLNLRRIALLILSSADDSFAPEISQIELKIVELLAATLTTSPSSNTRADIFILLRALALKTSPVHLAPLWPTIHSELQLAIASIVAPDQSLMSDTYNNLAVLEACKLLDTLLCIAPDEFQLLEWLYVTDTIDAVYRPADYHPIGLIDELAEELGSTAAPISSQNDSGHHFPAMTGKELRRPLLGSGGIDTKGVGLERKEELIAKVLRPFFSGLSIFAFERTYEMGSVDWVGLRDGILEDLVIGGEGSASVGGAL